MPPPAMQVAEVLIQVRSDVCELLGWKGADSDSEEADDDMGKTPEQLWGPGGWQAKLLGTGTSEGPGAGGAQL